MVVLAILCLAIGSYLWRNLAPAVPVLVTTTRVPVGGAISVHGAWYWVEDPGTPGSRLTSCVGSSVTTVTSGANIHSFSVGEGKIAWISSQGKLWSISAVATNGSGKIELWKGVHEPRGICIAEHLIFWIERVPAAVPDAGALPPLAATIRVMSAPINGGPATATGDIMELAGEQVVGVHGGNVYIVASRPGLQNVTAIYSMPLTGGTPRRIAAETGEHRALLTQNGTLYWTGPSREASQPTQITSIRRLNAHGHVDMLHDWMPAGGRLYETAQGVCYVDGALLTADAWPLIDTDPLTLAVSQPTGFSAVAAGGSEVLAQLTVSDKVVKLYRIPLR